MGNWNQILSEINKSHDEIRRGYLRKLQEITQRNIVTYYSGWLQKTGEQFFNITTITDEDKEGFMSCFYGLDKTNGLDLLVHSPGGRVTATESLIHYFREVFGDDIRVFVPQLAMSGGTLLALSGKEIWMGKHSNLGPIDPQFGSIPAVTLLEEVERAFQEVKADPDRIQIWHPILSQISPTLLGQAKQSIDLSHTIAVKALTNGMFKDDRKKEAKAKKIAEELTNIESHKEHDRHIHADECKKMGLKIKYLESDQNLQDAVLSVHHSNLITLANTPAAKIIENHDGSAFVKNAPLQPTVKLG